MEFTLHTYTRTYIRLHIRSHARTCGRSRTIHANARKHKFTRANSLLRLTRGRFLRAIAICALDLKLSGCTVCITNLPPLSFPPPTFPPPLPPLLPPPPPPPPLFPLLLFPTPFPLLFLLPAQYRRESDSSAVNPTQYWSRSSQIQRHQTPGNQDGTPSACVGLDACACVCMHACRCFLLARGTYVMCWSVA